MPANTSKNDRIEDRVSVDKGGTKQWLGTDTSTDTNTIKPTLRPMRPQANFIPLPWEFLCSLETRKKNTARLVAFKERNLLFKWKKVSTGTWAESQNQKDIIWDAVPNEDLHYWTFFSFLNDPSFTHCQENFLNK